MRTREQWLRDFEARGFAPLQPLQRWAHEAAYSARAYDLGGNTLVLARRSSLHSTHTTTQLHPLVRSHTFGVGHGLPLSAAGHASPWAKWLPEKFAKLDEPGDMVASVLWPEAHLYVSAQWKQRLAVNLTAREQRMIDRCRPAR